MNIRSGRKWLPVAVSCLLVAGILAPLGVLGQSGTTSQSQLTSLVNAADSSRSYAHAAVDFAAAHGLAVSSAQAQLQQGDSLLATAKTDAQSGSNLAAGLQAVQAAMSDYTGAAASASLALGRAGLTASVDYYVAEDAVAEVNATASVVISIATQVCANAGVVTSNASGFAQACAQVKAQFASAKAHLSQAAALLLQASGHTVATFDFSEVNSLVSSARSDVNASQSSLLTIAAYTYSQRGHTFLTSVVIPSSAKANATIRAEQTILSNLTQLEYDFTAYEQSQASASTGVYTSASTLSGAISQVDTAGVSTSVTAAQSTAAQVSTQMSDLLSLVAGLPSTTLLTTLVADANACSSATASYTTALGTAETQSRAYSGTQLSSFSSYLAVMNSDAASSQSGGVAYISSYHSTETALTAFISAGGIIPSLLVQLQQLQSNLATLDATVTSTSSAVSTSLQQETLAMAKVQTDFSSLNSVVSSSNSQILVSSSLVTAANSISAGGAAFLNATAEAAFVKIGSSVQATAQSAQSLVTSANACLQASISSYASSVINLSNSATALSTQTQGSVTAVIAATAYMNSDAHTRDTETASGRTQVSQALLLFSDLNVSGGVAAMAQAYLDFQAASTTTV